MQKNMIERHCEQPENIWKQNDLTLNIYVYLLEALFCSLCAVRACTCVCTHSCAVSECCTFCQLLIVARFSSYCLGILLEFLNPIIPHENPPAYMQKVM